MEFFLTAMGQQYRPSRKNLVVDREPDLHGVFEGRARVTAVWKNDSRLLIPANSWTTAGGTFGTAQRHTTLNRRNKK